MKELKNSNIQDFFDGNQWIVVRRKKNGSIVKRDAIGYPENDYRKIYRIVKGRKGISGTIKHYLQ